MLLLFIILKKKHPEFDNKDITKNLGIEWDKAKKAKQLAIAAYLEAKNIKNTYLLDDSDDSDESDESDDGDFDFDAQ